MKHLLLLSTLFIATFNIFAQQNEVFPCGTDEMHHELFEKHPQYNEGVILANEELESFTESYIENYANLRSGNPYIIPVVFHIIHDNGSGNINDDQIYDAVEQVNLQFRKLNADTTDIVQDFESIATDAEIEIRLAQLDPDGNCTNGITRTLSDLTNIGDHQVKSLIQWPPDQYLNVYVCNQAAGLAGHALLPAAADTIPEWDGIVMQHTYIGTIGTSDFFRRTVLTHEIGHYLNLQHIWGGNNVPNYYYLPVGDANNCTEDDGVADTPETIGWQSCNLSGTSCGTLDNVQNYMDYSYCARMFTEGQKMRMHAALNASVASRDNLWSNTNLIATGTTGDTNYLCKAHFTSDKRVLCSGETVTFKDISYHGTNQRTWSFDGGDITTSNDSIVQVTYNTPGEYDVSLNAGNSSNSVDTTAVRYIHVMESPGTTNGLHETFEIPQVTKSRWLVENSEVSNNWTQTSSGFNSNNSFFVDNFNGEKGLAYAFHSYPFDASGMSELAIYFDYAFAKTASDNTDLLKVEISNDCGNSWVTRRTLATNSLESISDTIATPFFPTSDNEWKEEDVSISTQSYLVDDLLIRFLFESDEGNNIFIDNIRISSSENVGMKLNESNSEIQLFPNPAKNMVRLVSNSQFKGGSISIFDAFGNSVLSKIKINDTTDQMIDLSDLAQGHYFVHIENSDQSSKVIKKLIVLY
ncbi:MAG: M43 family zinc metalloprotease [Brumimicrobium sp.]